MLIETIGKKDYFSAKKQIEKSLTYADGIELRLDFFEKLDVDRIKALVNPLKVPVIFTFRKNTLRSEENRIVWIIKLSKLKPTYFDLEHDTIQSLVEEVSLYTKVILSYHDFQKTPKDLQSIFLSMQQPFVSLYKIACYANSGIDVLSMLLFVKCNRNITGISMGPLGSEARVLGPIVGNIIDYSGDLAPGQIDSKKMALDYHYHCLDTDTKIFALIGDPVHKSHGSKFHNKIFRLRGQNAIYFRLKITKQELSDGLFLLRKLPFKGLSVTSPLKEDVVGYLDYIDKEVKKVQAVNTISIVKGKLHGSNTDGIGALLTIGKVLPIFEKKILILGAGGAARAIAYQAIEQGAKVSVVNRTKAKAKQLAMAFNCIGYGLEDLKELLQSSDLLINTTSLAGDRLLDLLEDLALPRYIMDIISNPYDTQLLKLAREKSSFCIYGHEMFIQQAILQQKIWNKFFI